MIAALASILMSLASSCTGGRVPASACAFTAAALSPTTETTMLPQVNCHDLGN